MRWTPAAALGAACAAAMALLSGCPSPWAMYDYSDAPRNAVQLASEDFLSEGGEPVTVEISADAPWQDTGVQLNAGEAVQIETAGMWNPDVGAGERDCGPGGYPEASSFYTPEVRDLRYGALIGRIGEGAPLLIGSRAFLAAREGGPLRMACNRTLRSTLLGRGELAVKITLGHRRGDLPGDTERPAGSP